MRHALAVSATLAALTLVACDSTEPALFDEAEVTADVAASAGEAIAASVADMIANQGAAALPLACAEFNLVARRCDIWLSQSFAPRAIVEHERMHCAGYDHVGSTNMKRFLEAHAGIPLTASVRP